MIIIASYNIPEEAKARLKSLGKLALLQPQTGVYKSIASHPDIFFCQGPDCLFVSPAIPEAVSGELQVFPLCKGTKPPDGVYPGSARYNAVMAHGMFIHKLNISDPALLQAAKDLEQIHVAQAYTRCNLLCLSNTHFITSDKGIEKTLLAHGKHVCYINPQQVSLSGHPHGFFGGACGLFGQTLYLCGSLSNLSEAEALINFLSDCGWALVELYQGPIIDVGSILFVKDQ
jgi:hypothetical protein